jgi:hypothetical protein
VSNSARRAKSKAFEVEHPVKEVKNTTLGGSDAKTIAFALRKRESNASPMLQRRIQHMKKT